MIFLGSFLVKSKWSIILNYLLGMLLGLFVFSCEKKEPMLVVGKELFPLRKGFYQIYKVKEEQYTLSKKSLEKEYFQKAQIISNYLNLEGDSIYTVEISQRNTENETWLSKGIYKKYISKNRAVFEDGSINTLKMIFPVQIGTSWNAAALSSADVNSNAKLYNGVNYFKSIPIKGLTLVVQYRADSSQISKSIDYEIYQSDIGLVQKEETYWDYCQLSSDCIGKKQIFSGKSKILNLINSGYVR
jgi:hypothetical protein